VSFDLHMIQVPESESASVIRKAGAHVFSLADEIPLRATLVETDSGQSVLVLVLHHIASDGLSAVPLMRDLSTAYCARSAGTAPAWDPLPVQYADYTLWQRDLLDEQEDGIWSRQLAYWRNTLADLPTEATLPADRPRPAIATYRGGRVERSVAGEVHARLTAVVRECGASLFMGLHAATAAALTESGAGTDICLGTPVAGRLDPALDDLVGFFVNTLVLRTDTSGDLSFNQLLHRVRESELSAWTHQDLPFEQLVRELNPRRSAAQHPLFQIVIALERTGPPALHFAGVQAEVEFTDLGYTKFDLTIGFVEHKSATGGPTGLNISIEYACDLYDSDTVQAFADHLVRLLKYAADNPDRPLSSESLGACADRRGEPVI
jgi:hypothetical protein